MTGLWYWVWWVVFCVLLGVWGWLLVRRYHASGRVPVAYVPLLVVLVVLVVYFPLAALGAISH